jgi:hypothetical protein
MPVRVVYYRPTHRHNWEMIGLWDQCDPTEPEEESNEFCLDLRKTAEWHAEIAATRCSQGVLGLETA